MLALYRFLTLLIRPWLPLFLRLRRARGKEHPTRWREKLAQHMASRPAGDLVWIHAASVGEANSVLPLITHMRKAYPKLTILLTTVTLTSSELMTRRLPQGAIHQFAPLDAPEVINRFLTHWNPSLAIWVESEFWPNMLLLTHEIAVPMLLLNARLSDRSFQKWRKRPVMIKCLLNCFKAIYPQSNEDAEKLKQLGAAQQQYIGNLKLAVPAPPADETALATLKAQLNSRPCWAAASIHPGELEIFADTQQQLKEHLLILIPRHPHRGVEMAAILRNRGFTLALRSRQEPITVDTQVYIADTLGELGLCYRLAPIVVMGGSYIPHGGQNPVEPSYCGAAVLYGPQMFNFTAICKELESAGASRMIEADKLAHTIATLYMQPESITAMAKAGKKIMEQKSSLLEETLKALAPYLPGGGA